MKATRDRARLPVWAQREIERLERDLASARAKLAVGPEDSDTFADPYSADRRPLGRGTTIEFVLDDDRDRIRVRLDQDSRGRVYLDVNASSSCLTLQPRSSNAIEITTEGR